MKQIRNDYSYISIKIRPLATFSRKVEKNVSKLPSGTAIENVKKNRFLKFVFFEFKMLKKYYFYIFRKLET